MRKRQKNMNLMPQKEKISVGKNENLMMNLRNINKEKFGSKE